MGTKEKVPLTVVCVWANDSLEGIYNGDLYICLSRMKLSRRRIWTVYLKENKF